jgi:hypothetical protein
MCPLDVFATQHDFKIQMDCENDLHAKRPPGRRGFAGRAIEFNGH